MREKNKYSICHFSIVHNVLDTRVFHRECVSLANWYDVTLIGQGTAGGIERGVRIIPIARPGNRLARLTGTARQAYRLARSVGAGLYHFHDPELIPWAWRLFRAGHPVIYDIHENVTESLKAKGWLPLKPLFSRLYSLIEARAARNFHFVLAEQSYEAVYRRKYPWKSCRVIQNYTPPDFLREHRRTRRPIEPLRIFYMGSLDHLYCLRPMLDSIRVLRRRGLAARLVMVGNLVAPIKAELERGGMLAGVGDSVEFCGFLEFQEGYAKSVDCTCGYCFVSGNLNLREPVPRKLYEYMQVGLPVVSSGYPLYRSLVEKHDTGICVEECTGEQIADAVVRLVSDPAALNRRAANAVNLSDDRFNWDTQAALLRELYDSILERPPAARPDFNA